MAKSNYESSKESIMRWQKENISRVTINLKKEEKEKWQKYAESQGIPLATLIRELMNDAMR